MRDRIGIGVIGVGGRGTLSLSLKDDPRVELRGGADISDRYLGEFKDNTRSDIYTTNDYRELLKRDDIDAIMVTSPDFCHEEHAVAALQAGKHLFCEKPLAISTKGCDRILTEWKKAGVRMMVGFNMRYMRKFRVIKEIVDSGAIGEIKAVWCRHFVGRGGEFYYHYWHATRDKSCSLLLQKGSHDIDMIHWITGRYTRRVTAFGSLSFYGGNKDNDLVCDECPEIDSCTDPLPNDRKNRCAFRKEVDVEDNNMMLMELEGGILASYLQCHFTPDYFRNHLFIGTEGRVELVNDSLVRVKTRSSNTWREYSDRDYHIKPAKGGHGGADPVICVDFVDMLANGKLPEATPIDGRMSVAAGVAAAQSLRNNGMPVDIPALPGGLE